MKIFNIHQGQDIKTNIKEYISTNPDIDTLIIPETLEIEADNIDIIKLYKQHDLHIDTLKEFYKTYQQIKSRKHFVDCDNTIKLIKHIKTHGISHESIDTSLIKNILQISNKAPCDKIFPDYYIDERKITGNNICIVIHPDILSKYTQNTLKKLMNTHHLHLITIGLDTKQDMNYKVNRVYANFLKEIGKNLTEIRNISALTQKQSEFTQKLTQYIFPEITSNDYNTHMEYSKIPPQNIELFEEASHNKNNQQHYINITKFELQNTELFEAKNHNEECDFIIQKITSLKNRQSIGIVVDNEHITKCLITKLITQNINLTNISGIGNPIKKEIILITQLSTFITQKFNINNLLSVLNNPLVNFHFNKHEYEMILDYFSKYILNNLKIKKSFKNIIKHGMAIELPNERDTKNFRDFITKMHILFNKTGAKIRKSTSFQEIINQYIYIYQKITNKNSYLGFLNTQSSQTSLNCDDCHEIFQIILNNNKAIHDKLEQIIIMTLAQAVTSNCDLFIITNFNEKPLTNESFMEMTDRIYTKNIKDINSAIMALLFHKKPITITRSNKIMGNNMQESRWLTYIKTFCNNIKLLKLDSLNQRSKITYLRPAPIAPQNMKPNNISTTGLEKLIINPYAFFIDYILNIKGSEERSQPNQADFGNIIHSILCKYTIMKNEKGNSDIVKIGQEEFHPFIHHKIVKLVWWKKFVRIAYLFEQFDQERRTNAFLIESEKELNHTIDGIKISARLDRIEHLHNGTIAIIDYKTGTLPSQIDMENGFSPQLPTQALLASINLGKTVSQLSFWLIKGDKITEKLVKNHEKASENGLAGIKNLVKIYKNTSFKFTATPNDKKRLKTDKYSLIDREKEWINL